jgi:DNA-binding Lrp family transcriptional regulator
LESSVFNIDEIDRNIIELIQKQPTLTHTEIAKKVNRSQPTIGMRIRKLESNGILKFQAGINVRTMDLIIARVEIQTLKPKEILNLAKQCPYMLQAFRLSGPNNISILMASPQINHLDNMVNSHFRTNPNVSNVYMDIITDITNDLVLPFDFSFDHCAYGNDNQCCGKCLTNNFDL